jgi:hypothetical protein
MIIIIPYILPYIKYLKLIDMIISRISQLEADSDRNEISRKLRCPSSKPFFLLH